MIVADPVQLAHRLNRRSLRASFRLIPGSKLRAALPKFEQT
jgi:hypothetical protein